MVFFTYEKEKLVEAAEEAVNDQYDRQGKDYYQKAKKTDRSS